MDVVQKSFSTKGSLKDWQIFYKKYFGISKDFSEIKIPVSKTGFNTLVVVINSELRKVINLLFHRHNKITYLG